MIQALAAQKQNKTIVYKTKQCNGEKQMMTAVFQKHYQNYDFSISKAPSITPKTLGFKCFEREKNLTGFHNFHRFSSLISHLGEDKIAAL